MRRCDEQRAVDELIAALGAGVIRGDAHARRLAEVSDRLRHGASRRSARARARQLAAWVGVDRNRRRWLGDRLRDAVTALAASGRVPTQGARREAWTTILRTAALLYDATVATVPTPAVIGPDILAGLAAEARRRTPRRVSVRTAYAAPGPLLKRLAVDPVLRDAVAAALGFAVLPAFSAVYMYDPPRSVVPPHLDTSDFDIVVHLVLAHDAPSGARRSALVLYQPDGRRRMALPVGAAVALCGRGLAHRWEPLGPRESRVMAAIGFARRSAGSRGRTTTARTIK